MQYMREDAARGCHAFGMYSQIQSKRLAPAVSSQPWGGTYTKHCSLCYPERDKGYGNFGADHSHFNSAALPYVTSVDCSLRPRMLDSRIRTGLGCDFLRSESEA